MSLYDLIFRRNRVENNDDGNIEAPQIQAEIIDLPFERQVNQSMREQVGNAYDNPSLYNRIRNKIKNLNMVDKYDDITENDNFTTTDEEGNPIYNMGVGTAPIKQRGFLNDFKRGANENFNNKFDFENWGRNKLTDGMPKNFATRLGEAAGSFGRFLNSPYGRGLLTAGIIGATGGNGIQAMAFGSSASRQNQQHLLNDDIYRKALKDYGIDTGNVKGYIDKDTFNSLANTDLKYNNSLVSNKLKELKMQKEELLIERQRILNSTLPELEKAKLIQENAKAQYALEMQEAKIYALRMAPQIALGNLGVAQGNLGVHQGQLSIAQDKAQREKEQQEFENRMTERIIEALNGKGGNTSTPAKPSNTKHETNVF